MIAGYSGTPLTRTLEVEAHSRVLVIGQPSGTDLGVLECAARHTRAGAEGTVDIKVCAIDTTWSGLAFVRRLRDR